MLAERAPQYNNYVTECITLKRIKGRLVLKDGAELSHRLRQPNYDMLQGQGQLGQGADTNQESIW